MANPINLDSQSALNMNTLMQVKTHLDEVVDFVQQVYLPDVCAIGALYAGLASLRRGCNNCLAVPDLPLDARERSSISRWDDP